MWAIYLATYLASHVWLSGSLLLPCMLLVRWGAAKWKGLHRLATSRERWILIWGCYGLAEIALLSALLLYWWHHEHFAVLPFESLGWAGMTVWSVLHVLIRTWLWFLSFPQPEPKQSTVEFRISRCNSAVLSCF